MRKTVAHPMLATTGIFVAALALYGCGPNGPKVQGWTAQQREGWYEASQGSRLVPYVWFQALEQPDSQALFSDPAYLESFGYIPSDASRKTGLPIGFAIDTQADGDFVRTGGSWYDGQSHAEETAEPWLGFNCSACHTSQFRYDNKDFRADGGPGLGDFQSFIEAFDKALIQTRDQPEKWERFAANVLKGKDTKPNRDKLRDRLSAQIAWEEKVQAINEPASPTEPGNATIRSGYARTDAFGHIYNKIALYNEAPVQPRNTSNAPVSYPFLWNIHLQKKVQWNGAAENQKVKFLGKELDYGALGRNAGEVFGVFGEVRLTTPETTPLLKGYKSTLRIDNLLGLEKLVSQLETPPWPGELPPYDETLAAKGKPLFDRHCASCHFPRDAWPARLKANKGIERMIPFEESKPENITDIWMACNAALYQAFTGNLKGTKKGYFNGDPIAKSTDVVTQLQISVKGGLVAKKEDLVGNALRIFVGADRIPRSGDGSLASEGLPPNREARRQQCLSAKGNELLAYKARPLDGIWATPPYLHNGSVPTLYHLLLPATKRPPSFWVGSRDYDPVHVGYVWKDKPQGRAFPFVAVDPSGNPVDGNSNAGHEYGANEMEEPDRMALLEYLKTL